MSGYLHDDGSVTCPLCRVTRWNMKLMLKHLDFWHNLSPPNARRIEILIETGSPAEIVIKRDGRQQRIYVEVPLPGF